MKDHVPGILPSQSDCGPRIAISSCSFMTGRRNSDWRWARRLALIPTKASITISDATNYVTMIQDDERKLCCQSPQNNANWNIRWMQYLRSYRSERVIVVRKHIQDIAFTQQSRRHCIFIAATISPFRRRRTTAAASSAEGRAAPFRLEVLPRPERVREYRLQIRTR